MKHFHFCSLILCALVFGASRLSAQTFEKLPISPPGGEIKALAAHPLAPDKILAASDSSIWENREKHLWKSIGPAGLFHKKIQKLVYETSWPGRIFVLTRDGLLSGDLEQNQWSEIYRGQTAEERSVLSFAISPEDKNHWFAGTEAGLFESEDAGKTWFPFVRFKKEPVSVLAFKGRELYVATGSRLYKSGDGAYFEPEFSMPPADETEPEDFSQEDSPGNHENETPPAMGRLVFSGQNLWLATRHGVYAKNGSSWKRMPVSGLRSPEIQHLVFSEKPGQLFAGTPKGLYAFDPETQRWREIFKGLENTAILGLCLIPSENQTMLVVSTPMGLAQFPIGSGSEQIFSFEIHPEKQGLMETLLLLEPSARELHKQVIRFGDLPNGKIKRWHAASRVSALLPNFSFGKDLSRGNTIDIDRGGTNDADKYILGPEDINRGWDMSVNWDLGDFIWSSDQTSIDSRSKLMVELRQDMLAEATRIFYERRRLIIEFTNKPSAEPGEHEERLLRIEELTALLDAMTGGYFSKRLEKLYAARPELNQIWEYAEKNFGGSNRP